MPAEISENVPLFIGAIEDSRVLPSERKPTLDSLTVRPRSCTGRLPVRTFVLKSDTGPLSSLTDRPLNCALAGIASATRTARSLKRERRNIRVSVAAALADDKDAAGRSTAADIEDGDPLRVLDLILAGGAGDLSVCIENLPGSGGAHGVPGADQTAARVDR